MQGENKINYGLQFHSYEVEKEDRTGLDLTPDHPFPCPEGFILEFDVRFQAVHHIFGDIFRLIGNDGQHIDLLISRVKDDPLKAQLTATYHTGKVFCNKLFKELSVEFDQWFTIRLKIDKKNHLFQISFNGVNCENTAGLFDNLNEMRIVFGKNDIPSYQVTDVPAMTVKNIYMKDLNDKPLYYWPLDTHTGNRVQDVWKQQVALSVNPDWIMDEHVYWKKEKTFTAGLYPKVFYNQGDNTLVWTTGQSFYSYHRKDGSLHTDTIQGGFSVGNLTNQLIYNTKEQVYYTYDFTSPAVAYRPDTQSWENELPDNEDSQYWHHNHYFSAANNTLYTFNGYGFHIFKNHINEYDFSSGQWKQFSYAVDPRYLSGLGVIDDHRILIFGGYGNESGNQELVPHNYYDLYEVDILTHEASKKWELNGTNEDFVVANSMVVDTLNRCFYALCFPNHKFNNALQLFRFSLDKPEYELLADSIPYLFNDGYSYSELAINPDSTQLIAFTVYSDEEKKESTVSLYSLSYPPLNVRALNQPVGTANHRSWMLFIAGVLIALASLAFLIRYIRLKKKVREINPPAEVLDPAVAPAIYLFGGFQVIDDRCENITYKFTPILKQLFLLILFYTVKNEEGISTQKLSDILWFGKTKKSAKNNRGVSLNKLRKILENISALEITVQNSNWTIQSGDAVYCDYLKALRLLNKMDKNHFNLPEVQQLVAIVSAGELLPNVQEDWIDSFKADFSNKLIDNLLNFISLNENTASSLKIKMADAIFVHDVLNEDALKLKCSEWVKTGKTGLAKKTYEAFIKEYKIVIGTNFTLPFEKMIV